MSQQPQPMSPAPQLQNFIEQGAALISHLRTGSVTTADWDGFTDALDALPIEPTARRFARLTVQNVRKLSPRDFHAAAADVQRILRKFSADMRRDLAV